MDYHFSQTAASSHQVSDAVVQCVNRLLQKRRLDDGAKQDFASARAMLDALPLSTHESDLASRRLQNAQHYLRYTEPGAAWYELRLVASTLMLNAGPVSEPRRRLRQRARQSR